MKKNLILIAKFAFVLAVGGVLLYIVLLKLKAKDLYANQEPGPDAITIENWKSYTNETFGISLLYPADWV